MQYLIIRILKKIPKQYDFNKVYKSDDVGLATCYEAMPEDPYHMKLKTSSAYASMEDIKQHILSIHPEYDMDCWSLSGGYYGDRSRKATGNNWEMEISAETVKSLEHEHISEDLYQNVIKEWSVEVPYDEGDAVKGLFPAYIDKKFLHQYQDTLLAYYNTQDKEWLDGMIGDLEYSYQRLVCLPALTAAVAYAAKCKGKCYARMGD